jgi:hypothetical protein
LLFGIRKACVAKQAARWGVGEKAGIPQKAHARSPSSGWTRFPLLSDFGYPSTEWVP